MVNLNVFYPKIVIFKEHIASLTKLVFPARRISAAFRGVCTSGVQHGVRHGRQVGAVGSGIS